MARARNGGLYVASVWSNILLYLCVSTDPVSALNVGIQRNGGGGSGSVSLAGCSRTCESEHCSLPPFLRYGKYCGILYSGCPGEKPCDSLDACCQIHDACVQAKRGDYLNTECSQNFLKCLEWVKKSGLPTFRGNRCSVPEVADLLTVVMEAALLAGKIFHRP